MRLPRPSAWLDDDRGQRHALRDVFVLGRSRDADLSVARGTIARRHVVLTRLLSGGFEAEDQQTTNGTRLNGQPLTWSRLTPGDVLELDATTFVFGGEPLPPPRVDEEALRVVSARDVGAALQVWLDAQVELGDPHGLAGERLPAALEEAVRTGALIVERQRGLVRAATLRTGSMAATRELLFSLLDAECARFLEVLTVPGLDERLGLHDAALTALRALRVGPFFTEEDAAPARRACAELRFACAPRLETREVQAWAEAWLRFPDDSSRKLRRGRVENLGGIVVRWGPGWRVEWGAAHQAFRHNGRKVASALLAPGDEVSSGSTRFVFEAR